MYKIILLFCFLWPFWAVGQDITSSTSSLNCRTPDRSDPEFMVIPIFPGPSNISHNSMTTFTLRLAQQPVIVCLRMSVWHQGTDHRPQIMVNGIFAGTLEPCFPSLQDRNYVFFLFNDNKDKDKDFQMDYNGWLEAACFIQGRYLRAGENAVTLFNGMDYIRIMDVRFEALYHLDSHDVLNDMIESESRLLRMMEEYQKTGHIRQ